MKKSVLFALLLSPALASASVSNDLQEIRSSYEKCLDSSSNMSGCARDAYRKSDALLNSAYQEIVASLKRSAKTDPDSNEKLARLKKSQRAWIAHRDANCALESIEMLGGIGERQIAANCQATETMDRVAALDRIFNSKH